MTSDEARTERVPLRFLPPGQYRATVWQDGAKPNDVVHSETIVKAGDILTLQLAAGGGAAVILEPLK
jgi:alpha-glucosidase